MAPKLKLDTWRLKGTPAATDNAAVTAAFQSLHKHPLGDFLERITKALASFDWRTSADPDLPEASRRQKLVFRGSSGYKELRMQLLEHLSERAGDVGQVAQQLRDQS